MLKVQLFDYPFALGFGFGSSGSWRLVGWRLVVGSWQLADLPTVLQMRDSEGGLAVVFSLTVGR